MNINSKEPLYNEAMAGRLLTRKPTESGARLRALRQAAGLSQTKLAEQLGILQRTLCFYELDADCIPSTLVAPLAQALGVSIEQILGTNGSHNKRGPKSQLERQLEAVAQLPRHQQKKIMDVVNALVAQNSNR